MFRSQVQIPFGVRTFLWYHSHYYQINSTDLSCLLISQDLLGKRKPNWQSSSTNQDSSPRSEPAIELNSRASVSGTSPFPWSQHKKQFQRRKDKKNLYKRIIYLNVGYGCTNGMSPSMERLNTFELCLSLESKILNFASSSLEIIFRARKVNYQ